jgi:hypothetical protein
MLAQVGEEEVLVHLGVMVQQELQTQAVEAEVLLHIRPQLAKLVDLVLLLLKNPQFQLTLLVYGL